MSKTKTKSDVTTLKMIFCVEFSLEIVNACILLRNFNKHCNFEESHAHMTNREKKRIIQI